MSEHPAPRPETIDEFKARMREVERAKYGKWASNKIDRPVNPAAFFHDVETPEDIGHLRNVMARGNYPASISDCFVVGINGNCGGGCPVLKRGECETQDEMEAELSDEDRAALAEANRG